MFKVSGLTGSGHKIPSSSRVVRSGKNTTQQEMYKQLAPLLTGEPSIKTVPETEKEVCTAAKKIIEFASEGVQEVLDDIIKECFCKGQLVVRETESGETENVKIEDVCVGDYVLSYDDSRGNFFERVVYTNGHEDWEGTGTVRRFEMRTAGKTSAELSLTADHFALVIGSSGECTKKLASEVEIGDRMVLTTPAGAQSTARVTRVVESKAAADAFQALHTISGKVVVNGVVVSCDSYNIGFKLKTCIKVFGTICPHIMTTVGRMIESCLHQVRRHKAGRSTAGLSVLSYLGLGPVSALEIS